MKRERRTMEAMVALYCRNTHGKGKGLCPECASLLEYSLERLARCPFQERKPACSRCPIHCYKPGMREKIRVVMRHAGPRMIRRHPVLALLHMMDAMRRTKDKTSS
jgi:predicted amidophosphoribosyltransferase